VSSAAALKLLLKRGAAIALSATGILDVLWNREPSWRILMYHRVIDPETLDYPIQAGMYVRPKTFQMHCEFLKKHANVISVDALVKSVLSGKSLPKRTVALTFDDGWRDNLENAFPILKSLDLPATVFLPTKFIGTDNRFWTDEIARALRVYPERFKPYLPAIPLPEEEKLEIILNSLFEISRDEREKAVSSLIADLPPPTRREFLNWGEVQQLSSLRIFVGSHSHSHEQFLDLQEEETDQEFKLSREILQNQSALSSDLFVFPRGSHDSSMATQALQHGYLATLGVSKKQSITPGSPVFPRTGIHHDISFTESLFALRLAL